ncbi:MAG TPA: flagellar export chaperone FlgN [Chloroflexota bacterium]|nr:flagellar export chaperone FlgN [Chloroflexota bacterium]
MRRGLPAVEALLQALRRQLEAFHSYSGRLDALITALVSAEFSAVQSAVAAQAVALGQVEAAERQRQMAEIGVIHALTGRMPTPGVPRGTLTISALLKRLPPQQASRLVALRQDVLLALRDLQTRQHQANALVRSAQTVLQRTAMVAGVSGMGYGPRGEQAMIQEMSQIRQGRWA